jgi:ADP-ribose diphosphatase
MWEPNEWFALERDARGESYIRPSSDEVLVVALDTGLDAGDELLLAREPSAAFGEPVLILPGGCVEAGEPHEATANRELQEELGFRAARLDRLGELWPWAKYLRLRSYLYLARELEPSHLDGDEGYEIGIERVPLAQLEELIGSGRLRDARAIAALYIARTFLDRETR